MLKKQFLGTPAVAALVSQVDALPKTDRSNFEPKLETHAKIGKTFYEQSFADTDNYTAAIIEQAKGAGFEKKQWMIDLLTAQTENHQKFGNGAVHTAKLQHDKSAPAARTSAQ